MPSKTQKPIIANYSTEAKIVYVRSIYSSKLKYIGHVSGKQYIWDGAGDVVAVNNDDLQQLLSKRIGSGGSCCGSGSREGNRLFELA